MVVVFDKPGKPAGKGSAASSGRGPSPAAAKPQQVVYQKEARAPRGRKAVYVDVLTEARLIQAAAELGKNRDDMANQAVEDLLRREASLLFEREFADANENAKFSVQRWEFQESWKPPAWMREPK